MDIHENDIGKEKRVFLVTLPKNNIENITSVKQLLFLIYNNLLVNNVITQKDIDILNKWGTYFNGQI